MASHIVSRKYEIKSSNYEICHNYNYDKDQMKCGNFNFYVILLTLSHNFDLMIMTIVILTRNIF